MKKEQLPDHIRPHCPDGLSDEQVEAWLLGYLARDSSSTSTSSEEKTDIEEVQIDRLEERKKLPGFASPSQEVTPSIEAHSSSSPQSDEIATDRPKKYNSEAFQDPPTADSKIPKKEGTDKFNPDPKPSGPDSVNATRLDKPEAENEERKSPHFVTIALVTGIISIGAYEVGIIPLFGLFVSVASIIYSYKNDGYKYGLACLATALNAIYCIMNVRINGHLSDGVAFGVMLVALIAIGITMMRLQRRKSEAMDSITSLSELHRTWPDGSKPSKALTFNPDPTPSGPNSSHATRHYRAVSQDDLAEKTRLDAIEALLSASGCTLRSNRWKGWLVIEPLGGRRSFDTVDDLEQYAKSR